MFRFHLFLERQIEELSRLSSPLTSIMLVESVNEPCQKVDESFHLECRDSES